MNTGALGNPAISVDGDKIRIVPNTFVYKTGKGTKTVTATSGGGNDIETVVTSNAEEKKSMANFEMKPTKSNLDLINTWGDKNAMPIEAYEAFSSGDDITLTFPAMTLVTDPEINASADGTIALEFEGSPVVV